MSRNPSGRLVLCALRLLPLHALSRAAGALAALRLPGPVQRAQIRCFGRIVGVDFGEVRDPIASFRSLQAFFTRALAEGARPLDPDPRAFVAPCDGVWGAAGTVERGLLLQVKGRHYSLATLLGSDSDAARYEGGAFATFYLAPKDYHRFHAPCDVRIARARYLPGALWPVNPLGVENVPGLFAENERICAFMEVGGEHGAQPLCIVAVGATLVGKIRLRFDDLSTHAGRSAQERGYGEDAHAFAKGQEWGCFEFGSSLIVLAAPGWLDLTPSAPGTPLRLGRRIGTLRAAAAPAPGGAPR
ncbi:MAG: archaetidylserine decarboxylase [Myxococcales bacterium]|nr:archaetidylserine decarboxylase [Myxococcales bacterium]